MVAEHEIKLIALSQIKEDRSNPNVVSKKQLDAMKLSMEKFGYLAPIVLADNLDDTFTVADGAHRLKIYKEFNKETIPAYVLNINDTERRILRQTLNKLRGEHDRELDEEEFKFIENAGELELLKQLLANEDKLLNKFLQKDLEEGDEEEPAEIETEIELGDIFQLGNHKLMCGDSTELSQVARLTLNEKVDLVYTDPPYGIDYRSESGSLPDGIEGDQYDLEHLKDLFNKSFTVCHSLLKEGGVIYVWHSDAKGDIKPIFERSFIQFFNMGATLIWMKNNASMGWQDYRRQHEPCLYGWKGKSHQFYGDRTQSTIWEIDRDAVNQYKHPTQKPVALAAKAIRNSSQEGEIVLDLFGGSG